MRVVGTYEYGPAREALQILDIEDPEPGPGEILIRVRAAAVNPTDLSVTNGDRREAQKSQSRPLVPGMDAAGTVAAVGKDTSTDLEVGDAVMAIVAPDGRHGAYSELLTVPAESVVRVPSGASLVEAATLPMNGLTARQALDKLGLQPGQALAVTGAAGAFGGYTVQLAKADGLVVVADASPADRDLVRALGADFVVDRGPEFATRVREVLPDGVDGAADGALLLDALAPAVRDGGRIATIRGYEGVGERGVTFVPVWVREYKLEHGKLDRLREQVELGEVTLRVAGTYPPERAAEAQERLAAGGTRGRLVLEF